MLAVDLDDTIADFMGQMISFYGKPVTGFSYSLRKMYPHLDIDAIICDPEFYRTLLPIDKAQEAMWWLNHTNKLIYLSARSPELRDVTAEWLDKWRFPKAPLFCVGKEGKLILLQQSNLVTTLIDDMEIFLVAQQDNAIVYNQAWNCNLLFPRISSWRYYVKYSRLVPKV